MSRLYDTYREFLNEVEVEVDEFDEEETDPYYLDLRICIEVPHSFLPVDTDWDDDAIED